EPARPDSARLAAVAAISLGPASCSGGGGTGGSTPASTATGPAEAAASSSPSPNKARPQTTARAKTTIHDFEYKVPNRVSPGEKISVRNTDDVAHTVTADKDKSLFDVNITPGETASFTPPTSRVPTRSPVTTTARCAGNWS
ncbi:MAG: hypothetical protein ACRDN9_21885, partial [Streptosporangiaceae bacterium]